MASEENFREIRRLTAIAADAGASEAERKDAVRALVRRCFRHQGPPEAGEEAIFARLDAALSGRSGDVFSVIGRFAETIGRLEEVLERRQIDQIFKDRLHRQFEATFKAFVLELLAV